MSVEYVLAEPDLNKVPHRLLRDPSDPPPAELYLLLTPH